MKRISAIFMCFLLVVLLVIPASAAEPGGILLNGTNQKIFEGRVGSDANHQSVQTVYAYTTFQNVYSLPIINFTLNGTPRAFNLFFISNSPFSIGMSWNQNNPGEAGTPSSTTSNSPYYIINTTFAWYDSSSFTLPFLDLQGDELMDQNTLDYIWSYASGQSTITEYNADFVLPAGNVAYIKVGANYNGFTASTVMPETNPIIIDPLYNGNSTGDFWPQSSQVSTWASDLPTVGQQITGVRIPWDKDPTKLNIAGLTTYAQYESIGPYLANGYQVIVNPLYYGGTANGPYEFLSNGDMVIHTEGVESITIFSLQSTMGFTSTLGLSVQTVISDGTYNGEIDPDTGDVTWTDPDGNITTPEEGGGNLQPTQTTITGWLKNIATQLSDFFKGPIDAVSILASAVRDFAGSLKSLYSWLPGPVYSILTAAITTAITIGVIKVFI